MSVTGSQSEASKKAREGRVALGCFFTLFLLIGLAVTFFMFIVPVFEIIGARNWRPTPCTILSSEVERHRGSKGGSTYSVSVSFEYFVDDQRHVSSRYKFIGGSSSGYESKKAAVDRMPPGPRRPAMSTGEIRTTPSWSGASPRTSCSAFSR